MRTRQYYGSFFVITFMRKILTTSRYRNLLIILMVLMSAFGVRAQENPRIAIPGTRYSYTFPSTWKYLQTTQVDENTNVYLYCYVQRYLVNSENDTVLPFLRVYVKKNYKSSLFNLSFDRYMKQPYQSINDYQKGLGLPLEGGLGYEGVYTDVNEHKDYHFRMVYFKDNTTAIEFRLETTDDTYSSMEEEFVQILSSLAIQED